MPVSRIEKSPSPGSKKKTGFPVAPASAIIDTLSAVTTRWSANARKAKKGLSASFGRQR